MRHVYQYLGALFFITAIFVSAEQPDRLELLSEVNEIAEEYFNLAETFRKENEYEKALGFYQQALKADPNHFLSLCNVASLLFEQNKVSEAIEYYHRAHSLKSDDAQVHYNLGTCYVRLNDSDTAIKHFNNAIAIDPECVGAHTQLGDAYKKKYDYTKALTHYQKAIAVKPDSPHIYHNMGRILKQLNRLEEALEQYQRALNLKPQQLNLLIESGNLHNMLGNHKKALNCYLQVLEINPNLHSVLYNFGFTLKQMGYIRKAIAVYKKILDQKPDYTYANFSLALSYLTLGDFEHGWPAYEWRWNAYNESPKKFDSPLWDGSNLVDKTILVYAEQGMGDTFQFIRYAKLLKAKGARVIFQTQNALAQLLANCSYLDQVIKRTEPVPQSDYHIALMSLPMVFKTKLSTIPADVPYLSPDQGLTDFWQKKLSSDTNFKIGICWQGNAHYRTQALKRAVAGKSFSVKHFEPLSKISGISLYSLQKINGTDQLEGVNFTINEFGPDFDESHGCFMDTAAIMKNLDLIITVDTSIAHLAGALGVPVWVVLPNPADWRWLLNRTDSLWYPTMHLFRQKIRGDWDMVMQDVCKALQDECAKRTGVKQSGQVNLEEAQPITFESVECNLPIEELIDKVSCEKIFSSDNELITAHLQHLEKMCQDYITRIPALQSLCRLLDDVNDSLKKLAHHIDVRGYGIVDSAFADIAKKIYQGHQVKTNIKKKIRELVAVKQKDV